MKTHPIVTWGLPRKTGSCFRVQKDQSLNASGSRRLCLRRRLLSRFRRLPRLAPRLRSSLLPLRLLRCHRRRLHRKSGSLSLQLLDRVVAECCSGRVHVTFRHQEARPLTRDAHFTLLRWTSPTPCSRTPRCTSTLVATSGRTSTLTTSTTCGWKTVSPPTLPCPRTTLF